MASEPSKSSESRQLVLRISSDPAELAPARKALESAAAKAGMGEKAVGEIGLCVNEALANVIRHAYNNAADRPIVVIFEDRSEDVVVSIRDWGTGESPHWPPRQHNPAKPGGLGLICMQSMMNEVHFRPQPDGMLLELIKQKPKSGA